MVSFKDVKNDPSISEYIRKADQSLAALGFTEHSFAHVGRAVSICEYILSTLGFDQRDVEIAKIAAYMHDIGNLVNRVEHSQSGAIMAFRILDNMGMPADEISTIVTAIGNHDEGTGVPVNEIAAALILADKSDVRRSRVRNADVSSFDIHDRVNYSVTRSELQINDNKDEITLILEVDTRYSSVMDYFEIFMQRMLLCRKAADRLGMKFHLQINGQILL